MFYKKHLLKNKKLTFAINNKRSNSNNISFNSNNSSSIALNNKNVNCKSKDKLNNKNNSKIVNRNGSFSKILEKKEDNLKNISKDINNDMYSNFNTFDNNIVKDIRITIYNSILKKDLTGKPFLEYVCEVRNGKEKYVLNKKFGHFIMLYKALKTAFKDNSKLPR